MIKPATILLLALTGLALLGRLDRDGLLARADVAARALGYEVRVEVKLLRARPVPVNVCPPQHPPVPIAATAGRSSCE
jgi:hypothetical protein